jgi:hypothetical protein
MGKTSKFYRITDIEALMAFNDKTVKWYRLPFVMILPIPIVFVGVMTLPDCLPIRSYPKIRMRESRVPIAIIRPADPLICAQTCPSIRL